MKKVMLTMGCLLHFRFREFGWTVERLGFWLVRVGSQMRRPTCKCSLCQGDMYRLLDEAEDRSWRLAKAEEKLSMRDENLLMCEE